MKTWIWGVIVALGATVAVAAAGIESTPLFQEYQRRTQVKYQGYGQAVLTVLSFKGLPWKNIAEFSSDEATNSFEVKTQDGQICKGTYKDRAISYECAPRWNDKERRIIAEIGAAMLEDTVVDIEILGENFIFQTANNQFCRGNMSHGKAAFNCYSKAGLMSFSASGDSD
ncbi:MAG: hypothetical protein KF767_13185 [Bdellovibrionaceae bacterium]|nr:hypothetical protein [Pseudobdellovibrionaceae bacterium]